MKKSTKKKTAPVSQSETLEYSLLENGLDFISSALKHLKNRPTKRELKYAVLHLSAGIELILKERLKREHWSLVFDKPELAIKQAYDTGDFSSVSFKASLDRLINISGIKFEEKQKMRLMRFRDMRNRFEHFGIVDSTEAVTASAAAALAILLDFIKNHLEIQTMEQNDQILLDEIRSELSEFKEFVRKRWRLIESEVKSARTAVIICPRCGQAAAVAHEGATCLFCGYHRAAEYAAREYAVIVLGEDPTEGWPDLVQKCPDCDTETLVQDASASRFVCLQCGNSWKDTDFDNCLHCGQSFKRDGEQTVCDGCFEYAISGDD